MMKPENEKGLKKESEETPSPAPFHQVIAEKTVNYGKFANIAIDIRDDQVPILYSTTYNIRSFYIEKFHPFDVSKWGRIFKLLIEKGVLRESEVVAPNQIAREELLEIHTEKYLDSLNGRKSIARISELCVLQFIPTCISRRILLKPLQFQVGGSVLGVKLALERGWAINLGGGFHHASSNGGGGFCFYADISLCAKFAFSVYADVHRIMIIDLDAHQGNGCAKDLGLDRRVFILDMYNYNIYPHDSKAFERIRCPVLLDYYTSDDEYLEKMERQFLVSLSNFPPHLVIYNAGTDCLAGDPLGLLSISAQGIIKRDEIVFRACLERKVPILMLTSGGYLSSTAQIIADSIENLVLKEIIDMKGRNGLEPFSSKPSTSPSS